jgi:hypothetical protein
MFPSRPGFSGRRGARHGGLSSGASRRLGPRSPTWSSKHIVLKIVLMVLIEKARRLPWWSSPRPAATVLEFRRIFGGRGTGRCPPLPRTNHRETRGHAVAVRSPTPDRHQSPAIAPPWPALPVQLRHLPACLRSSGHARMTSLPKRRGPGCTRYSGIGDGRRS